MAPEQQQKEPKGYAKLANFMTCQNHVIIRQFRELATRDLLYLQAELCDLQYDFTRQSKEDVNSNDERIRRYDREWVHLRHAAGGDGRQWQLALQIREKLREYYSAIQQYQNVAALPQPTNRQRSVVYSYTLSASLGGDCDFLGRDLSDVAPYPSVLSGQDSDKLLFLGSGQSNDDSIARFLVGPALQVFDHYLGPLKTPLSDIESQTPRTRTTLHHYSDNTIRFIVQIFSSFMSTAVPMTSIIILYLVQSITLRLGLVCFFSIIFSTTMSLVTNARRVKVFAAAAAFASVQVVFVSTSQNP
ncbi:uncharacterized protein F4822DRAFT_394279 [Hypoxylon trugodes]|uniref:uncharacterized protein n=1 Tax=Hypoxylon trugodes TaxID=326681 RepID=UPI002191B156|nr:uncharacterized protein F4822DRAFT_394279 [Hypoxylon trugodes]KAI1390718.1 hypothetical protein F4822DRAFT_394279 [Hypoxylon trugodes]